MHGRAYRLAARGKVWLESDRGFVVGDGGVRLLQAIEANGSIRAAADRIGWSNRHAIDYLDKAESALGGRLVNRARGGNERGGARLTPEGKDLVRRYITLRRQVENEVERLYRRASSPS